MTVVETLKSLEIILLPFPQWDGATRYSCQYYLDEPEAAAKPHKVVLLLGLPFSLSRDIFETKKIF